ncbi:MAG TPA: SPFH domain-containing protein [Chitinophagales bacterium]|nr:SPFH domain-containing protein [Chitinophagales bacterium]HNI53123.1 SPFH domain-containing protein [Chitinophagales bacterium]HNJ88073.1 SPFH domain-containing protein [Chitinophagales bacterium]HNM28696.1 SPFH domain-containing protein [Chitinophagales bacterium]HNO27845.1 SPFH domain-containing protein [Chitinophagales bacterium]
MITDKIVKPSSGFFMFFVFLLMSIGIGYAMMNVHPAYSLAFIPLFFVLIGFFIINPNDAKVLVLFGKYAGTVTENGFYWANPFYGKHRVSLKARTLDGDKIKVNDKLGNPIIIGAVVVWQVDDAAKAKFEVENYEMYVKLQSDTAVRHLAGSFSYDHFSDNDSEEITLRSGGEHINEMLVKELKDRLQLAGVKVIEARITHLAYAEEIAGAMLQRQQATAVVAARTKIVEGAVGMVQLALQKLSKEQIVELDEEKKAAMVSNLLVVLCSDKAANPVVNTGTLYH